MTHECNDVGLDTIEAGNTLAIAMEGGVIPWGDGAAAMDLLAEVQKGSPMGRIIGQGVEATAKAFGVHRVPTCKGQSMPAYEPRAVKGIGVTYATTPMGADHTAGYTIAPEIAGVSGKLDPLSDEGKAELSLTFQAATAFIDSTGYCLFIAFPILDIAEGLGRDGRDRSWSDRSEYHRRRCRRNRQRNPEDGAAVQRRRRLHR